jgi:sulfoxide reductase heme-binding subunit YedZ
MTAAAATWPIAGSLAAALPHLGGPEAIVVTSSTPLWYITRATGVVALVLLTTGMALGLLIAVRFEGRQWPRFITIGLHRNLSLLALAFTVAHVLTTITDNFVPIDLQDALVPFISPYRPLWLGLGAIAFDLLIALTVTSLLRARLGHRSWRLVHWTAYLCWPVAAVHGLGTGSDTRTRWVLVITLLCVVAIACLTGWRLADGWPAHPKVRVAGAIALAAAAAGRNRPGAALPGRPERRAVWAVHVRAAGHRRRPGPYRLAGAGQAGRGVAALPAAAGGQARGLPPPGRCGRPGRQRAAGVRRRPGAARQPGTVPGRPAPAGAARAARCRRPAVSRASTRRDGRP